MNTLAKFSIGAVKTGARLVLSDESEYRRLLARMAEGVSLTVTIEEEGDRRSVAANRYLWQIYTWIQEETGQPKELTHFEMCERYLRKTVTFIDKASGLTLERTFVGGSSGLTVRAFYEFVEKVRLFAGEWLEMTIPDPDPEYRRYCANVQKEAA